MHLQKRLVLDERLELQTGVLIQPQMGFYISGSGVVTQQEVGWLDNWKSGVFTTESGEYTQPEMGCFHNCKWGIYTTGNGVFSQQEVGCLHNWKCIMGKGLAAFTMVKLSEREFPCPRLPILRCNMTNYLLKIALLM